MPRNRFTACFFAVLGALASAAAVTIAPSIVGAATANVVPVPASIDATGAKEVSQELNAFFASVPDGSTITFPSGARYWTESSLYLVDRHGLTFEGNGARFFAKTDGSAEPCPDWTNCTSWPRTRYHWRFTGGSGITLRNLAIQGGHQDGGKDGTYLPEFEAQHGIDIAGTAGITLDRVTITDVWGDFVHASTDPRYRGNADTLTGWVWTTDLVIRNSFMERNGRQGIALTAVDGAEIVDNHISDTRRATIDIEPDNVNRGALDVTIARNYIGPGRLLFIANAGAAGPVGDIRVLDNRLDRTMSIQVVPRDTARGLSRRGPFVVRGNVSTVETQSQGALLQFVDTDGVTVEGNVQQFKPYSWGAVQNAVEYGNTCGVGVGTNMFDGAAKVEHNTTPDFVCPESSPTTTTTAAPTTTSTTTTTAPTTTTTTAPTTTTTTTTAPAGGLVLRSVATSVTAVKGQWTATVRWRLTNDGTPVAGKVVSGTYDGGHKFGATGTVACTTNAQGECSVSATVNNKSGSVLMTMTSPTKASTTVVKP